MRKQTYYVVLVVDLQLQNVLWKSRPFRSKARAEKCLSQKADGDKGDLNPPNGFLPLLIPVTV